MPGSMLTLLAWVVVQSRVLNSPKVMVCGFAEKETSGGRAEVPPELIVIVTEVPGVPLRKIFYNPLGRKPFDCLHGSRKEKLDK